MDVRIALRTLSLILTLAAGLHAQRLESEEPWGAEPPPLEWVPSFDEALARARQENKPLIMAFSVRDNALWANPYL